MLYTFGAFFALWTLMVVFAATDNFVTIAGMQLHGLGFRKGIPLMMHLGCLVLDALPFPALMALWLGWYGEDWKWWQILLLGAVGFVLSMGMHWTYVEAGRKFPEFTTYGGRLTAAGWTHVVYMGLGFAIIGLAYLCTPNPAPWLVWLTTIYLVIHVTIGVHVIHKLWGIPAFPYHKVLEAGTLVPIGAATVILLGLAWWTLRSAA